MGSQRAVLSSVLKLIKLYKAGDGIVNYKILKISNTISIDCNLKNKHQDA